MIIILPLARYFQVAVYTSNTLQHTLLYMQNRESAVLVRRPGAGVRCRCRVFEQIFQILFHSIKRAVLDTTLLIFPTLMSCNQKAEENKNIQQ